VAPNYNATNPITFNATTPNSPSVSWTLNLTYTTTGGKCKGCTNSQSLTTASGANGTATYQSMGGQLVATATDGVNSSGSVTAYVVGAAIPTATEVALLNSSYSGATTNLLNGIAQVESSTTQFVQKTNFGVAAYWPTESLSDGGSHIGLLMLPVAMGVAWDYNINVAQGASLFGAKLASATRIMNSAINTYSGLPALNAVQLENMALVLYGPYAAAGATNQYYAPSCQGGTAAGTTCSGGTWVWVVNTANNAGGVAYANKCRASVH